MCDGEHVQQLEEEIEDLEPKEENVLAKVTKDKNVVVANENH